ncbi:MAG: cadmium-translocating P-type ATPase [Candidatus Nomurabacteria bacterium]|nr:cadmium-translocating P-type ATPase [Candidatus Nomurabacteria bacterium]
MKKVLRDYWRFWLSLVVGAAGLILQFSAGDVAARILLGIFSGALGLELLVRMLIQLKSGKVGVDILAISAIAATLCLGQVWATWMILVMLTGGQALENFAGRRAGSELTALLKRQPTIAHLWLNGRWQDARLNLVKPGQRVLVRPGETVGVDGILLSETGEFDESSLTGESLPVALSKSGRVMSGAICLGSPVEIEATAAARSSQYAKIIRMVKAASAHPAPFARLADRYAVGFTIVSFIIAIAAWIISGNPLRLAEVLVLASPCPLILAVPIALISGQSLAAKRGVMFKTMTALEKLAAAKTMAFDKTGTLTRGIISVEKVEPANGFSANDLVKFAASAEQNSDHILAKALVKFAATKKLKIAKATGVREITGGGVAAKVDGHAVVVGKAEFLTDNAVKLLRFESDATVALVAIDGRFAGGIEFADQPRSDARRAVIELEQSGLDVLMLTGDQSAAAEAVANKLGISHWHAGLLPAGKVGKIRREKLPRPIAMVGDGVNDAPVLAAADVGIALGARGSAAASEAADVIIMTDHLIRVATARRIARRTMRVARQSALGGIGLCVVLMLIATTGAIPALGGAILQEAVDLCAIGWALNAHRPSHKNSAKNSKAENFSKRLDTK